MPQSLVIIHNPIAFLVKNTTDASFVLLTANFTTEVVASSILPARAVEVLQQRLQAALAAAPVKADVENGFAGLVRSLLTAVMFESGSFTATVSYAAPVATFTLGGLGDPSHIGISVPMSTSSPLIGNP